VISGAGCRLDGSEAGDADAGPPVEGALAGTGKQEPRHSSATAVMPINAISKEGIFLSINDLLSSILNSEYLSQHALLC